MWRGGSDARPTWPITYLATGLHCHFFSTKVQFDSSDCTILRLLLTCRDIRRGPYGSVPVRDKCLHGLPIFVPGLGVVLVLVPAMVLVLGQSVLFVTV